MPINSTLKGHRHAVSLPSGSKSSASLHRRTVTVGVIPKPSHRPPSTLHSFRGDIKTQDIFFQELEKRNRKLRVLFPGEDTFELERMEMWNHDAICTPCLILQPLSNKEVSVCLLAYTAGVLKCLAANRKHGAALAVPRLCVAGGRNSLNAMRDGSIVLDLSRMRSVKVDVQSQTCEVQGGARVVDLDSALGDHGLMAVSGTCQNLGVVGCILGGGLGYASRKFGLACDNVLRAEVVLADGRLKHCSPTKHQDLFWSICGGGGGTGVIVSIQLRCFPLRHAALLTFDLLPTSYDSIWTSIRKWANWICGDADNHEVKNDTVLQVNDGAPEDLFSQLLLHTNAPNISFLGTSINSNVIVQSEADVLKYDSFKKMKKRRPFSFLNGNASKCCPTKWHDVPGLSDLCEDTFGAANRVQENFQIVGYSDQLQAFTSQYQTAGNVFIATKFANALTNRILKILIQSTFGDHSRKNESRITIMSAGGAINNINGNNAAFDSRNMKYVIFIEGRWDADSRHREQKEKEKTKRWVNWIVNQLHLCEGIKSSAHPESNRDRISMSNMGKLPSGWYNFSEQNGRRLMQIKQKRDPKKVFSLASRVSWAYSSKSKESGSDKASAVPTDASLSCVDVLKDGEVNPIECLIPRRRRAVPNDSWSSTDSSEPYFVSESDEEKNATNIKVGSGVIKAEHDGSEEDSIGRDVKMLLSIVSDPNDDDLQDWSFPPEPLTNLNFEGNKNVAVKDSSKANVEF